MHHALSNKAPKYLRYVGGIGSGKSLIGCVTVLAWAIQHPGTYLIARQFYPELKDTTYQTFLEICPPKLIAEHRVADKIIKIRGVGGKISTILFRPLEEPDKLRSLNLSGFYIDEANQVSEAAFILLQGRLRGKGLRKGIITQNSGGHDWSWRWFVKKDMHKLSASKKEFMNIVAPSTENVHLPDGYVEMMLSTWSEDRIQREIMANEDIFEGAVYPEFRYDTHVIKPFKIPDHWPRIMGSDHGFRNPAVKLWAAVDNDGRIYLYREFYKREWDIEEVCLGKKGPDGHRIEKGVVALARGEKIEAEFIDPATKRQQGRKETDLEVYQSHTPWPILPGNNKKELGIDRVKQFLKVDEKSKKPMLYVFNNCTNFIDEIQTYRYQELTAAQEGRMNLKEEPVKNHDHAMDSVRYMLMSRPEPFQEKLDWYERTGYDYHSPEGAIHRDRERVISGRKGNNSDPWGDGF